MQKHPQNQLSANKDAKKQVEVSLTTSTHKIKIHLH